jgi:hypothetical protein
LNQWIIEIKVAYEMWRSKGAMLGM